MFWSNFVGQFARWQCRFVAVHQPCASLKKAKVVQNAFVRFVCPLRPDAFVSKRNALGRPRLARARAEV